MSQHNKVLYPKPTHLDNVANRDAFAPQEVDDRRNVRICCQRPGARILGTFGVVVGYEQRVGVHRNVQYPAVQAFGGAAVETTLLVDMASHIMLVFSGVQSACILVDYTALATLR